MTPFSGYSCSGTFSRIQVAFSCFLVMAFAILSLPQQASAQSCNCLQTAFLRNINVCIANQTYSVRLEGCETFSAAGGLGQVCPGSGGQNRITIIKNVCFNGAAPATWTPTELYSAIECTMDPCAVPDQWNVLPVIYPALYCWTMRFPQCVTITANPACVYACDQAPCCSVARRFALLSPTNCSMTGQWRCSEEGPCLIGCTHVTCSTLICCPIQP